MRDFIFCPVLIKLKLSTVNRVTGLKILRSKPRRIPLLTDSPGIPHKKGAVRRRTFSVP
jgi:hypothetical protein